MSRDTDHTEVRGPNSLFTWADTVCTTSKNRTDVRAWLADVLFSALRVLEVPPTGDLATLGSRPRGRQAETATVTSEVADHVWTVPRESLRSHLERITWPWLACLADHATDGLADAVLRAFQPCCFDESELDGSRLRVGMIPGTPAMGCEYLLRNLDRLSFIYNVLPGLHDHPDLTDPLPGRSYDPIPELPELAPGCRIAIVGRGTLHRLDCIVHRLAMEGTMIPGQPPPRVVFSLHAPELRVYASILASLRAPAGTEIRAMAGDSLAWLREHAPWDVILAEPALGAPGFALEMVATGQIVGRNPGADTLALRTVREMTSLLSPEGRGYSALGADVFRDKEGAQEIADLFKDCQVHAVVLPLPPNEQPAPQGHVVAATDTPVAAEAGTIVITGPDHGTRDVVWLLQTNRLTTAGWTRSAAIDVLLVRFGLRVKDRFREEGSSAAVRGMVSRMLDLTSEAELVGSPYGDLSPIHLVPEGRSSTETIDLLRASIPAWIPREAMMMMYIADFHDAHLCWAEQGLPFFSDAPTTQTAVGLAYAFALENLGEVGPRVEREDGAGHSHCPRPSLGIVLSLAAQFVETPLPNWLRDVMPEGVFVTRDELMRALPDVGRLLPAQPDPTVPAPPEPLLKLPHVRLSELVEILVSPALGERATESDDVGSLLNDFDRFLKVSNIPRRYRLHWGSAAPLSAELADSDGDGTLQPGDIVLTELGLGGKMTLVGVVESPSALHNFRPGYVVLRPQSGVDGREIGAYLDDRDILSELVEVGAPGGRPTLSVERLQSLAIPRLSGPLREFVLRADRLGISYSRSIELWARDKSEARRDINGLEQVLAFWRSVYGESDSVESASTADFIGRFARAELPALGRSRQRSQHFESYLTAIQRLQDAAHQVTAAPGDSRLRVAFLRDLRARLHGVTEADWYPDNKPKYPGDWTPNPDGSFPYPHWFGSALEDCRSAVDNVLRTEMAALIGPNPIQLDAFLDVTRPGHVRVEARSISDHDLLDVVIRFPSLEHNRRYDVFRAQERHVIPLAVPGEGARPTFLEAQLKVREIDQEESYPTIDVPIEDPSSLSGNPHVDFPRSPYITGSPVSGKNLYGRVRILGRIRRELRPGGPSSVIILEGNRRSGKTSILDQLQLPGQLSNWMIAKLNVQEIEGSDQGYGVTDTAFWQRIAEVACVAALRLGVMPEIPGQPADHQPTVGATQTTLDRETRRLIIHAFEERAPFEVFRNLLDSILERSERNQGFLLLFDEFDKVTEGVRNGVTSAHLPENLRSLFHSRPRVSGVIAGSKQLRRSRETYLSALFGLGVAIPVGRLDDKDARDLVVVPPGGDLIYTDPAVDEILRETDRHPFLIQLLCSELLDRIAHSGRGRGVRAQDVREVAQSIAERESEQLRALWGNIGDPGRQALAYAVHELAPGGRQVAVEEIRSRIGVEPAEQGRPDWLNEELSELVELDVLARERKDDMTFYRIGFPLLARWLDVSPEIDPSLLRNHSWENLS